MNEVKLFCPGTIANVSCGFDVLGLCLDSTGDEMVIKKVNSPGVKITKIIGQDLPLATKENVAGVAVLAMLEKLNNTTDGFEIEIYKNIKPGSGIGSSAASSAGAVYGVNELLGKPFSNHDLIEFAMKGEELASGVPHADNVAPALLGGFTLVRSTSPLDVLKLNTPSELFATVIHPQIEVKTADARQILKSKVRLKTAITQWGNIGALVSALYTEDYDLLSRSLQDEIIEPIRSILIPAFDKVKEECKNAGALGSGISGSGPSIFALSKGEETAKLVAEAMKKVYDKVGVSYDIHISKINDQGIKVIS